MDNKSDVKWSFVFILVSGVIGYGLRAIGIWVDGGDFSVLNIIAGGSPEISWLNILALLCYGLALSCLGIVLGGLAMISRATMPGARVRSRDIRLGRYEPHEATGQFIRYGWMIMLAILLFASGPIFTVVLILWHLIVSLT